MPTELRAVYVRKLASLRWPNQRAAAHDGQRPLSCGQSGLFRSQTLAVHAAIVLLILGDHGDTVAQIGLFGGQ